MEMKIPAWEMAGIPTVPTRAAPRTRERKIVRKFNIGCLLSFILRLPSILRGLRGFRSSLAYRFAYRLLIATARLIWTARAQRLFAAVEVNRSPWRKLWFSAWFSRGYAWSSRGIGVDLAWILPEYFASFYGVDALWTDDPLRADEGEGELGDFAGGVGPGKSGSVLGHGVQRGAVLEQAGQLLQQTCGRQAGLQHHAGGSRLG